LRFGIYGIVHASVAHGVVERSDDPGRKKEGREDVEIVAGESHFDELENYLGGLRCLPKLLIVEKRKR